MPKILVVDDEPDILNLIVIALSHAGYVLVTAEDGLAAITVARQEMPDLILMDVKMPKLNGYEACRRIKAEVALQHIPVMFLSVRGADDEIQIGFEAGAAEYLVKPFAPDELLRRVASVLASQSPSAGP